MNKSTSLSKTNKCLIILIICFLISTTLLILFFCKGELDNSDITFFIGSTKDIFQILFFIIVGIVTILSYKQASKTLFTPIKTETFKMQIKAFEDILSFFQTKTETDFTKQFDFDFIVNANAQLMLSDYISTFFSTEININTDKVKDLEKEFYGAAVTHSWAEKNFISPEYFDKTETQKKEEITNPAIILENWKHYEYGPIHYTKKYYEETEKISQLIASPLIPIGLKNKLEEFSKLVNENLLIVGGTLNEISKELPQKFPTAKSIKKFEAAGLWNKYNEKQEHLEPLAKEILLYIRNYLKIDKLID
ncbi:hypothetical protein [uncultured Flavobacterium sp.]|uniref:hypothetical protein n=1 Tax=uncultured Flavobacterium sp. TaxID=165435 RepID=UPI00292EA28B|nr:hypothetical protein [uncultured Flavobacterium sp.]